MSGAELAAPYISRMKDPKRDFPRSMWLLALMTGALTIFGTLALAVFFDANNIPERVAKVQIRHEVGVERSIGGVRVIHVLARCITALQRCVETAPVEIEGIGKYHVGREKLSECRRALRL